MSKAADYLVKLYDLPDSEAIYRKLKEDGVSIQRAMALDRSKILRFIGDNFDAAWVDETTLALSQQPLTCFLAIRNREVVGFACYDATSKGFFGPTGVKEDLRGQGIGTALLYRTLEAMREAGYGYAIIGWVTDAAEFYRKTVAAAEIPDSFPGVYGKMIDQN